MGGQCGAEFEQFPGYYTTSESLCDGDLRAAHNIKQLAAISVADYDDICGELILSIAEVMV